MHFVFRTANQVAVQAIRDRMREEHAGYYGLPHGERTGSIANEIQLPVYGLPYVWLGYGEGILCYWWVASSGNVWMIDSDNRFLGNVELPALLAPDFAPCPGSFRLAYWGRRHGQRWFSPELLQTSELLVYETSALWLKPWETNDTQDGLARWACEQDNLAGADYTPSR